MSIIKLKLLLTAALLLVAQTAFAQGPYPSGPITLVVPYVAGASTDTLARLVGKSVSEQLKQPVVVENKPGAGGIIASDFVKRQKADGYTFMLTTDGILSVNPSIYKNLPYDSLKEFGPLSIAVNAPLVLVVKADSPFKSVKEIIEHAKQHPNGLNFGSAGVGTSQHIAGALFNDLADIKITHVPYKGGSPAMTDLLGGHISMMFVQTASAESLAKDGKIRILAIGSPKRSPTLPNVATFQELGLAGYDSDTWYGFDLRAGADPKIVATLNGAIVKALEDNRKLLESLGYTVVASSPQQMTKVIKHNRQKWQDLTKKAGIYHLQ